MARRGEAVVVGVAVLAIAMADPLRAQSVVERTPNVEGVWTPGVGVVHFHFVHRFTVTDPPARKVLNSPTFLLGTGVTDRLGLGLRYASNSRLVPDDPNELEVFARGRILDGARGSPLDATAQMGYNGVAESVDGELALSRDLGPVTVLGGLWAFSRLAGGDAAAAWVAGGVWRVLGGVALAGDAAAPFGRDEADLAWGAGLQVAIPTTPHSLSLHVSNANTTTLQGASIGEGERRWGFEFTVPFTLSRYFGGSGRPAADAPPGGGTAAVVVEMNDRLRFLPDTVRIRAGEVVEWRNTSNLIHTVTADPGRAADPATVRLPEGAEAFDSGDLRPGQVFARTFTLPGTYRYVCVPHERAPMIGVVVVEP